MKSTISIFYIPDEEGSFGSGLWEVGVSVRGSCSAASEVDMPMEIVLIDLSWTNDVGGSWFETRIRCVSEDELRGTTRDHHACRGEFGGLYGELGGRGLRRTRERGASVSVVIKRSNMDQRVEIWES